MIARMVAVTHDHGLFTSCRNSGRASCTSGQRPKYPPKIARSFRGSPRLLATPSRTAPKTGARSPPAVPLLGSFGPLQPAKNLPATWGSIGFVSI
jgi:hypothetical protein